MFIQHSFLIISKDRSKSTLLQRSRLLHRQLEEHKAKATLFEVNYTTDTATRWPGKSRAGRGWSFDRVPST